jgi:hypothetical protein
MLNLIKPISKRVNFKKDKSVELEIKMITKHNFDVLLGIRLVKKIKTAGNGLKL